MLKLHQTMDKVFSDNQQDAIRTSTAKGGFIRIEDETISFKLQAGNVADYGVNGVQCEEILAFVHGYLDTLNSHFSSPYNEQAIHHIQQAINELNKRTEDRKERGVEGKELT